MAARTRIAIVYDGDELAECALCALLSDPQGPGFDTAAAARTIARELAGALADIVAERCVINDATTLGDIAELELTRRGITEVRAEGALSARVAIEAIGFAKHGADAIAIVGNAECYKALVDALHTRGVRTCTAQWRRPPETTPRTVRGHAHRHIDLHTTAPSHDPARARVHTGTVQRTLPGHPGTEHPFDYGFIDTDSAGPGARGLFFHRSGLGKGVAAEAIVQGVRVTFETGRNERGACAQAVHPLGAREGGR